jgi:hypothetical protein
MKAEDTDAPTGRLIETIHQAFGATPERWRRDRAGDEAGAIDAALAGFWLERARSAPPAGDLGPG